MPTIHMDDEVCEAHLAYAWLWQPTAGQEVATLVRLHRQPLHTVDLPSDRDVDDHGDGHAGEVLR